MICYLKGKLAKKNPSHVIIDVNGIGYKVSIPLSTFDKVGKVGEDINIFTYHHVREDAVQLFGFATEEEKELFEYLISISGIGPKVALIVLSGSSIDEFKRAVKSENIGFLSSISGIGKKTAERIVLELKNKIDLGEALMVGKSRIAGKSCSDVLSDAILALVSLGYKQSRAQGAVTKVLENDEDVRLEDLIRKALRSM